MSESIVEPVETEPVVLEPGEYCRTGFVTHFHEDENILCLVNCDCGKPTIMPALFQEGQPVTLTILTPAEDDPRGQYSPHPRVDLHINPSDEFHHNPCLTFDACGPCLNPVWETIFANGGGRIGVHAFPDEPDQVLFAEYRIENWKQTRQAIRTANERLVETE